LLTGFGRSHNRLPLSRLIVGEESGLSQWAKLSLEAARLAPSAVNRQPWGFEIAGQTITVFVRTSGPEFTVSKRLDCGIAMLHIELAALSSGIKGSWEFLEAPKVARFAAQIPVSS
jgi:hypothetical protein